MFSKLRKPLLSFTLLAVGCTNQTSPEVRVEYREVEKPVAVPCRIPELKKPEDLVATLKPTDSLFTKVKYLLAAKEQKDGYVTELETAVQKCNENK